MRKPYYRVGFTEAQKTELWQRPASSTFPTFARGLKNSIQLKKYQETTNRPTCRMLINARCCNYSEFFVSMIPNIERLAFSGVFQQYCLKSDAGNAASGLKSA